MPVFDQRHQHVTYQYNAAGDINFGMVQNRQDAIIELEKLQREVAQTIAQNVFEDEVAIDVDGAVKKAVIQAKKPEPNKKAIVQHLEAAKALIGGVTAAAGLVTALAKAAEMVQQLF